MTTTKNIYLVLEQGSGIIHRAFEKYLDAEEFIIFLQKTTGFECYEIQSISYTF